MKLRFPVLALRSMCMAFFPALMVFCTACASLSTEPAWDISENQDTAEALFFRDSGVHSGLAGVYIGTSDNYVLKLKENEYAIIPLPPGPYTLRAGSYWGFGTSKLDTAFSINERKCFRTRANPGALVVAFIPILIFAGIPDYNLEEVSCPSPTDLQRYSLSKQQSAE